MTEHIDAIQLSRYVDGEIPRDAQDAVEQHLLDCVLCAEQMQGLRDTKLRLVSMPHHVAPAELMRKLKGRYMKPSWSHRIRIWFTPSQVWKPVGALAAVAAAMALWVLTASHEPDVVSLAPLVAAHSRYEAESLVPSGDILSSDYSAQLAAYHAQIR